MSSTALKIAFAVFLGLAILLAVVGFSMSRNFAARTASAEAEAARVAQQQQLRHDRRSSASQYR